MEKNNYSILHRDLMKYLKVLDIKDFATYSLDELNMKKAEKLANVNNDNEKSIIEEAYRELYNFYLNTRGKETEIKLKSSDKTEAINFLNEMLLYTTPQYDIELNQMVLEIRKLIVKMIYDIENGYTDRIAEIFRHNYVISVRNFLCFYLDKLNRKYNYVYDNEFYKIKVELTGNFIMNSFLDYLVLDVEQMISNIVNDKDVHLQNR